MKENGMLFSKRNIEFHKYIYITLFMAVALLFSRASVYASVKSGICGGEDAGSNITWELSDAGTLTLSGSGEMKDYEKILVSNGDSYVDGNTLVIKDDSTVDGNTLILGDDFTYEYDTPWRLYKSSIKKIVIHDGITTIGNGCFSELSNLTEIRMPYSLSSVGDAAFENCTSLASVILPEPCTSLSKNAFHHCTSLSSIRIIGKIDTIPEGTFSECTSLTSIRFCLKLPEQISDTAFVSDSIHITYPDNSDVTSLSKLEKTDFTEASVSFESYPYVEEEDWIGTGVCGKSLNWTVLRNHDFVIEGNGNMYDYVVTAATDQRPWSYFSDSILRYDIGEKVTYIGANTFYDDRTNMQEQRVIFHGKLPEFSENAFSHAIVLGFYPSTDISWLLASLNFDFAYSDINWIAYDDDSSLSDHNIIYYVNHGKCGDNVFWTINDGTLYLSGEGDTYNYENRLCPFYKLRNYFTKVYVEDDVTSIGSYAFSQCENIQDVYISDDVLSIGEAAFKGCDQLTSIRLPEDLEEISPYLFEGCSSLSNLTLPENVSSIGAHALESCVALSLITLPDNLEKIGEYAFSKNTRMTLSEIPATLYSIGNYAFKDCDAITEISLAEVREIGMYAFADCDQLTTVTIGNDYSSDDETLIINSYAFSGDQALTDLELGENVSSIDNYAFLNCISLKNVTIPEKIKTIGSRAFGYKISSYTYVLIPDFSIKADASSVGESYANSNSISFELCTDQKTEEDSFLKEEQTLVVRAGSSTIKAGKTTKLTVTGNRTPLTFKSSKPSVASVSSKGKVTGKKSGTVTITVTAVATKRYKKKTAKIKIHVLPKSVSCLTVSKSSRHKIKVQWKAYPGAKGYLIQYADNKNFKNLKSCKVGTVTKTTLTVTSKKTFYIRICALNKSKKRISEFTILKLKG